MKKLIILLLICVSVFAQDKKPDTPKQSPIAINANLKAALDGANRNLRIAQLEKSNLILQMRLILKVPNEFEWSEETESFIPPVEKGKP